MDTKGESGGVMNWEIGIDIYTLICIKWITNKNLLYKKINKIEKLKIITQKTQKNKESCTTCSFQLYL